MLPRAKPWEKAAAKRAAEKAARGKRQKAVGARTRWCICDGRSKIARVVANHKQYKHKCVPGKWPARDGEMLGGYPPVRYSEYCAQLGL